MRASPTGNGGSEYSSLALSCCACQIYPRARLSPTPSATPATPFHMIPTSNSSPIASVPAGSAMFTPNHRRFHVSHRITPPTTDILAPNTLQRRISAPSPHPLSPLLLPLTPRKRHSLKQTKKSDPKFVERGGSQGKLGLGAKKRKSRRSVGTSTRILREK